MLIQTKTQALILETFQGLMKDVDLTIDDDLVSKGFDSLQAVAGAMLLRKNGLKLAPQDIQDYGCIRDVAQFLDNKFSEAAIAAVPSAVIEPYPLTPTQQDWNDSGFHEHYNIYGAWSYTKSTLDLTMFSEAVDLLVNSQEELRLRISDVDGELVFNSCAAGAGPFLEKVDFSKLESNEAIKSAVEFCIASQTSFRFNGSSPLCKFVNIVLDDNDSGWIFIIVHHFTVDGFGWGNLLRKLSHFYQCLADGEEPTDIYGGSGVSRNWSKYLEQYGKNAPKDEFDYWLSLPWASLNTEFIDSLYPEEPEPKVSLFNILDAARLEGFCGGEDIPESELSELYSSQATIVKYLSTDASRTLLDRRWAGVDGDKFDDFDLFAAAASGAISPYCDTELLWMDMLAATRSGVFSDIDASGSLGYFSELTPFVSPVCSNNDLRQCASAVASFQTDQPMSGVGLRALKSYNEDISWKSALANMSLPQVGINYHASLLYHFTGTMLDLPKVPFWLGPTMDENGIRYHFWFRVSYANGKVEIVLRYNPKRYCVRDGMYVAEETVNSLESFLSQKN